MRKINSVNNLVINIPEDIAAARRAAPAMIQAHPASISGLVIGVRVRSDISFSVIFKTLN